MTDTVGDDGTERQSSPPTRRVVDVMSLLVEHADTSLTLADIVRATGIPRGTAHAIVTQLCTLGWLTRRGDNTLTLGVIFLAASRRAARVDVVAAAAAPALQSLVHATGLPAFLAQRDGDTITVTDQLAPDSPPGSTPAAPPVRSMQLRPPLCREFIAWSDDDTRAAWLQRAPADQRPRLTAVLAAVRDRGYSIERITDDHRAIIDALRHLDEMSAELRSRMAGLVSELSAIDYLPDELVDDVGAVSVGAPIFDDTGAVVAALVARPDRTMPVDELLRLGDAVRHSAAQVGPRLRSGPTSPLPDPSHRG
ncbi:helix-turn-helix domain-containing protein [Gordonia hydrophobica]|uniref:Helix-turn-helix domain-containing protein n=1 Tax=Gordonia hydrophobica TaxID=40516 RepID=A0ABZ2U4M1_9ACTN|nr:helix-turn-helix domain-containing protein [Gordonia hydrophobica]MBM7367885.1 DNA-binding IclR family transcriptional regulator [Gordonia hydrophobica]